MAIPKPIMDFPAASQRQRAFFQTGATRPGARITAASSIRAHFERLVNYLRDGKAVHGGRHDAKDLFIAPTVLAEVSSDAAVMQEEIFAPVLPVLEFDKLDDTLALLRDRPTPLALYVFTRDRASEARGVASGDLAGPAVSLSAPKTFAFRTEAGDALSFERLTLLQLPILFNH